MNSKSLHVLLIHEAFAGPNDAGGTRHYELGERLVAMGHHLTVLTSGTNYLTGKQSSARRENDGIRILQVPTLPGLHRSYMQRAAIFVSFMLSSLLCALRVGNVDIVMATSPSLFQALSAWAVARLKGRRFLLEIRDLWPQFAIEVGVLRNAVLIGGARWVEGFLYRRADHIVVNSPAYQDYLRERGVASEKVTLIPNGVDASMYCSAGCGERIREEHGWTEKFVIMYAGALGLANDIDVLLRAANRLKHDSQIEFCIVGDGKESQRLHSAAERMELTNLSFLGAQPKSRMPAVLAAGNVCVATLADVPGFRTTYPNKVFDYMAAGRPTVFAIDGVIRRVIEESAGGIFVPPGDDSALAAAILSLKQCPQVCHCMGLSARDYVFKHFNRDQQAEQLANVMLGILAQEQS